MYQVPKFDAFFLVPTRAVFTRGGGDADHFNVLHVDFPVLGK